MKWQEAEFILKKTYSEVQGRHGENGREYIRSHWNRYVETLTLIDGTCRSGRVLEIGASILSNAIARELGYRVKALVHPSETEWTAIYKGTGIEVVFQDLMEDALIVESHEYDLILFNEVLEHFYLDPGPVFKFIVASLKKNSRIIFSTPNFACSEKRWALLRGRNPQENLNDRQIYYAHIREPVLQECIDYWKQVGARILNICCSDCRGNENIFKTAVALIKGLLKLNFHPALHALFPNMRNTIFMVLTK
ncbi:MAG: methyltransferase domain-containing protein [Elusimicrobiota bacterium]